MILSIDLGGTKVAFSVFDKDGSYIRNTIKLLNGKNGKAVGRLITEEVMQIINAEKLAGNNIKAIGVSVPGIARTAGTVWAPNIEGWEDYPLQKEIMEVAPAIPVIIESDRTCYILGEKWKGGATGCTNAVYLAVGTGIGAGIITHNVVIKGAQDIGGAIGWMAVRRPAILPGEKKDCALEAYASGTGIAVFAKELMEANISYNGPLKNKLHSLTALDIFEAFDSDEIAQAVINECIAIWGIAVANVVSIFNPEKVILGGGVFGPATRFIHQIKTEAAKWAQPLSATLYSLEPSALGQNAGLFGAAYAALVFLNQNK